MIGRILQLVHDSLREILQILFSQLLWIHILIIELQKQPHLRLQRLDIQVFRLDRVLGFGTPIPSIAEQLRRFRQCLEIGQVLHLLPIRFTSLVSLFGHVQLRFSATSALYSPLRTHIGHRFSLQMVVFVLEHLSLPAGDLLLLVFAEAVDVADADCVRSGDESDIPFFTSTNVGTYQGSLRQDSNSPMSLRDRLSIRGLK